MVRKYNGVVATSRKADPAKLQVGALIGLSTRKTRIVVPPSESLTFDGYGDMDTAVRYRQVRRAHEIICRLDGGDDGDDDTWDFVVCLELSPGQFRLRMVTEKMARSRYTAEVDFDWPACVAANNRRLLADGVTSVPIVLPAYYTYRSKRENPTKTGAKRKRRNSVPTVESGEPLDPAAPVTVTPATAAAQARRAAARAAAIDAAKAAATVRGEEALQRAASYVPGFESRLKRKYASVYNLWLQTNRPALERRCVELNAVAAAAIPPHVAVSLSHVYNSGWKEVSTEER
jgi:hypothetical protein